MYVHVHQCNGHKCNGHKCKHTHTHTHMHIHTHILSSSSTSIVTLVSESGSTRSVIGSETDSTISSSSSTIWSSWIGTVIHCTRTVSLNETTSVEMEIRRATSKVGSIKIASYMLVLSQVISGNHTLDTFALTITFPKYHFELNSPFLGDSHTLGSRDTLTPHA